MFMETKRIEHMDKWLILKQAIKEKGYALWQMQYSWDNPEGFIVGFMKHDKRLTVITHNKDIEDNIVRDL